MVWLIELLVLFLVFTLMVVPSVLKNPLSMVYNCPTDIYKKAIRFCHSKRVIIPGTEGMKGYKDYWFHARGALNGMLLGIPCALAAGAFTAVISL